MPEDARSLARLSDGSTLQSVMITLADRLVHEYRIANGPDHGRRFSSLRAVTEFLDSHGLTLTACRDAAQPGKPRPNRRRPS